MTQAVDNSMYSKDLKTSVHQCSTPNMMIILVMSCKEEWEELPKDRCVKLVYSKTLEAVMAAKGAAALSGRTIPLNLLGEVTVLVKLMDKYSLASGKRWENCSEIKMLSHGEKGLYLK